MKDFVEEMAEIVLDLLAREKIKDEQIAMVYANAIGSIPPECTTEWTQINKVIIDRWGINKLKKIKKLAWGIVRASTAGQG